MSVSTPELELLELVARSRDYEVHEAWDAGRACRVIAKLVRPDRRDDPAAIDRLVVEGERLRVLTHPHIVRAYETRQGDDSPVVILELLGGETLSHRIRRRDRRLGVGDIAWLGLHLASALHYLHAHELLHLDLKASNVIDDRGQAKLIDLSLARPPGPVPVGLGTAEYLSPEQARGGEAGAATDVWGLGAVLHAAATGHRPFGLPARGAPFEQLERRATPVATLRRLPVDVAEAIDACLEPDPEARPSLEQIAQVLDHHAP